MTAHLRQARQRAAAHAGTSAKLEIGKTVEIPRSRGYSGEAATIGGLPSALAAEDYAFNTGYVFLIREDVEDERAPLVGVIAGIVQRYLQRGSAAPPTPGLEEAVCRHVGLDAALKKHPDNDKAGSFGYRSWESDPPIPDLLRRAVANSRLGGAPELDPLLRKTGQGVLDSEEEGTFLAWAAGANGNWASYLLPQVHFADLGGDENDFRRVDFLYCDGCSPPFIVEVDGIQHEEDSNVDASRDETLQSFGLIVKRIPANVLKHDDGGESTALREFEQWWRRRVEAGAEDLDQRWVHATRLVQDGAALQFALTSLWASGSFQHGTEVVVTGAVPSGVVRSAFADWTALVDAVIASHGLGDLVQKPDVKLVQEASSQSHCRVVLAPDLPWWHEIPQTQPEMIVRGCATPRAVLAPAATDPDWKRWKQSSQRADSEARRRGLRWILQAAFRKREFREGQEQAVLRCLDGKDTVVLLPTGAGKSLIYQMSGLLCPGTTLVVAPLVALINDQKEGLANAGIRRVEGLSADQSSQVEERALANFGKSLLVLLLAPERLQKRTWAIAIAEAARAGAVSFAVVDEAHCVSEWGHDFRPVYAQLGRILRDKLEVPALLAMTGTASRAVYRDMMAHLEIGADDPQGCIRPSRHDRPEIKMSLRYCTSRRDAEVARSEALGSLRRRFRGNPRVVFQPRGARSCCGIIFMPTVKSFRNGIQTGMKLAERAGLRHAVAYASQAPYLDKRADNARKFKRNAATVMVATSGYGMGVDKPNVRWIIHPHLTTGLEAYYQQIGRAGRDRETAYAMTVLHDEQPDLTNAVLDPGKSFDEARKAYEEGGERWDDVGTAVFFHFGQFAGAKQETEDLIRTSDALDILESPGERRVAYQDDQRIWERDIGRLMRLSIVRYYDVDYGSKRIVVHVDGWDRHKALDALRAYISRFDPARGRAVHDDLEEAMGQCGGGAKMEVEIACRAIVSYLYEAIEPARRRSLLETVEMARECSTDEQIRRRMLNYLSEGKGAEKLDELVSQTSIDWNEWHKIFGDVKSDGPMEASRVRGLFIRALESNPGHPALLLGRAISEAACDDAVLAVVEENLRAALGSLPRYARAEELDEAFNGVCGWLESADREALAPMCGIALWCVQDGGDSALGQRLKQHAASKWTARSEVDWLLRIREANDVATRLAALSESVGELHMRTVGAA